MLVVASQLCLSQQERDALRAAVGRGCGLILTWRSGECDENNRQWENLPLADLAANPRVRYFEKCPGRTSQVKDTEGSGMHAAMPAQAAVILQSVRELAQQGLAAELAGGDRKQPLTFVDVYRMADACLAHVVWYGDGEPEGLRLRVAPWLAAGDAQLYSPYLPAPLALKPDADRWLDLPPTMGCYAAVKFRGA